jgi:outer membrane scaffolding protein for murein synthesis (MipA/OmpV family)
MRTSATRKLAIGILAAAGIAAAAPVSAQGVWVGAGPVGVGVGVGPVYNGYYDHGYYGPAYRSYAYDNDDYAYVGRRHCRTIREDFNGRMRTIRRCW